MTNAKIGTAIANFVMIHEEVDATWITNHMGGLLDTTGTHIEITTIPFSADEHPRPDATFGMCRV